MTTSPCSEVTCRHHSEVVGQQCVAAELRHPCRKSLPSSINAGSCCIISWLADVFRFDQGRRRPHTPLADIHVLTRGAKILSRLQNTANHSTSHILRCPHFGRTCWRPQAAHLVQRARPALGRSDDGDVPYASAQRRERHDVGGWPRVRRRSSQALSPTLPQSRPCRGCWFVATWPDTHAGSAFATMNQAS
jgi:hypothetical protein